MPTSVIMPELGESIVEGTVVRWLKQEGEPVQEDEPLVEIMTDKVNTELPAPATGILQKILAEAGTTVQVGQPLALIAEAEGRLATPSAPAAQPTEGAALTTPEVPAPPPPIEAGTGFYQGEEAIPSPSPPAAAPARTDGKQEERRYSPLVQRMAREHGISKAELAQIQGTGTAGRVTKFDLQRYLSRRKAAPPIQPEIPAAPTPLAPTTAEEQEEIIPLVGMRKIIAERLTQSYQTLVHVTTVMQVDVSKLVEFRERNKDSFQQQYGVRLTYTPFFAKATAEALMEFPMLNASLIEDKIVVHKYVHLGVAVALGTKGEEGLIVPVIRDAHRKSLIEIARELEELAQKARENRISPVEVQGATFTLTNPGSYGALIGTPIINYPQSAILGTYAIVKTPVVINDMLAIRSLLHLCLSYDHRLIDGMYAGRFLKRIKEMIENMEFFR